MAFVAGLAHIGEAIYADSESLIAQCPAVRSDASTFPTPPGLGTFVFAPLTDITPEEERLREQPEEIDPFVKARPSSRLRPHLVFGVVSYSQTSSLDPGRRAVALGIGSMDELRQTQPQIFELLTSEFSVRFLCSTDNFGIVRHQLPAAPPTIHSFLYPCGQGEVKAITEEFGYLRTLLTGSAKVQSISPEDLTARALCAAWKVRDFEEQYLITAGKAVLRFVLNDYDRFRSVMDQVTAMPRH